MNILILAVLLFAPQPARVDGPALVIAAREQVGVTTSYDSRYRKIAYPGGDVEPTTGVCSDVVIRSFRKLGIDLQRSVHEDMQQDFRAYPQSWGLRGPDTNIDHRRVPNLMKFFDRIGKSRPISSSSADYLPGDIVAWNLGGGVTHIGVVSDKKTMISRTPLIIHNIGAGVKEEDVLFSYKIIGHYRYFS
jgi:uncharacterized protein YijF (DUF1287 family)